MSGIRKAMPSLLCLMMMLSAPSFAKGDVIKVLTETFPPFNYEENGEIRGASTKLVQALLKEADLEYEIEIGRWSSMFSQARDGRNTLLYSVGRTSERENLFYWIGPLFPMEIGLYSSDAQRIRISHLEDARNYRIGVVRGDMRDQLFTSLGGFQLTRYRNSRNLLRGLERGRVDVVPLAKMTVPYVLEHLSLPSDAIELVFESRILHQADLYIVLGRESDPELAVRLQQAWKRLESRGELEDIRNQVSYHMRNAQGVSSGIR